MNHCSKKEVKNTLKDQKITPFKGLGQNFLVDNEVLQKIIKAADINSEDIILEIGPGTGILTKELAKKAKKVLAVEKDLKMRQVLEKTLKEYKNVKIICEDILKIDLSSFMFPAKGPLRLASSEASEARQRRHVSCFKVVANLPYYIASPVIRMFLEAGNQPSLMVLMVQKEVAQRICSRPPDMNLLAISVQFYAKPEIISFVKKESFWPKPKVDSAIIKITPNNISRERVSVEAFFRVVKAGFSQPRKQLVNNLSKMLKLDKQKISSLLLKTNIQPSQRAETLFIKDWLNLTRVL